MDFKDLIVTPFYLILLYAIAFIIRPYFTNNETRKYFIPALSVKFFGAISLGLIYQFYYEGGDTYNYFVHGGSWIWKAFLDSPEKAFQMIFGSNIHTPEVYEYSSKIWYFKDSKSYFIVRIVGFLSLFTLNTYSATALLFASYSFLGAWKLFQGVQSLYSENTRGIALATLFIPSVIFWGSGILKDTITYGSVCFLVYCLIKLLKNNQVYFKYFLGIALFSSIIIQIKVYIIVALATSIGVWFYFHYLKKISSPALKIVLAPFLVILISGLGYSTLKEIGEKDQKYALENIPKIAAITSYDIRYGWGARTGGDGGYSLGTLDGTWSSMVKLLPAAINVSLFRPYIWEVRNPLMLLSAIEAMFIIAFTLIAVIQQKWRSAIKDPFLVFCLFFSLTFAFAVGISTYNFGTLMRYKIPLVPFYGIFLVIAFSKRKNEA